MSNAVDVVERLLQVLSVLRAAEGAPVPRAELVRKVTAYGALGDQTTALKKLMQNDHKAMVTLGFEVEDVAPVGEESSFVLRPGTWQLPVDLSPYEQGLLVWVTAAAGATAAEDDAVTDLSALLGSVPRSLDLVQSALATGRALVVVRDGSEVVFEPGMLASRGGRWFLIGRYPASPQLYGVRLDRLEVSAVGEKLGAAVEVTDPDEVLDPTAWPEHEVREAELHCRTADLGPVLSWFPRAQVVQDGEVSVLRFPYRNEEALLTRVIGLAGAISLVAPSSARRALLRRVESVLTSVDA